MCVKTLNDTHFETEGVYYYDWLSLKEPSLKGFIIIRV